MQLMSSSKKVLKLRSQCTWDGVKGKHRSGLAWFLQLFCRYLLVIVFSAFTDNVLSYCEVILLGFFWYTGFKIVRDHSKLFSAFSSGRGNGYSTSVDAIGNQFQIPRL